jgi:hypothetical protein
MIALNSELKALVDLGAMDISLRSRALKAVSLPMWFAAASYCCWTNASFRS